jgi:hypothetical protein
MCGRMIQVTTPERKARYVVAQEKGPLAIAIIRMNVATHGEQVEDLGPVTDTLVRALNLEPGQYQKV